MIMKQEVCLFSRQEEGQSQKSPFHICRVFFLFLFYNDYVPLFIQSVEEKIARHSQDGTITNRFDFHLSYSAVLGSLPIG